MVSVLIFVRPPCRALSARPNEFSSVRSMSLMAVCKTDAARACFPSQIVSAQWSQKHQSLSIGRRTICALWTAQSASICSAGEAFQGVIMAGYNNCGCCSYARKNCTAATGSQERNHTQQCCRLHVVRRT